MSHRLISLSPDLFQLRSEGYDIEVRSGHLLLKSVPYVDADRKVRRGTLVSPLTVNGDKAGRPNDHTLYFVGSHPHTANGTLLEGIRNNSQKKTLADGLVVDHRFSAKPKVTGKYRDYHHKMTTYVAVISGEARKIDAGVTAQTCAIVEPAPDDSPFCYLDTSSTRAGVGAITAKLQRQKIALVGCGGTGSYIVDLVSKTPVAEIHLYDGDTFSNHNAFRSPGAASLDDLRAHSSKVAYLKDRYSKMHRAIHAHEAYLTEQNIDELKAFDFVFLCLDRGQAKKLAVDKLQGWGKPFIDVGMGVEESSGSLRGQVRVTTSTPSKRDHLSQRVSLAGGVGEDDYASNIQIADLNALNAALAVIKWKKLCGFYQDLDHEHHCLYTINGNQLVNEDVA
ncbi:MAG: ThiF family adenylyltransferase [Phycisphaeraceae bacterium]